MKNKIAFFTLGLLTLPLAGCGTNMSIYPNADKYLAGNQEYSENISSLDIDWISGSLTLVEDASIEGVKIEEVTNMTEEKGLVHSYLNDGELKIKFFASGYRAHVFNLQKDLTVTYKPGLTKINIDLTSGSLNAEKVTATTFELDMTSGSTKINNLVADEVETDSTSGSIEITNMTTKNMKADMTSGTYTVGFTSIEKASFSLTSGSVNMTLPEDGGVVKVDKTSGSVITDRECIISDNTYTFGSGTADIKVSMTSGKLKIH
jgi:DUF4097 and DUF4098 domain-containing protein YvlB